MGIVYGILGEDKSDKDTILAIIRSLACDNSIVGKGRGFNGKGNLLNNGARELRSLHSGGCRRFVICLDSDDKSIAALREDVRRKVIEPSGVPLECCIVIAVRAIESWILADIDEAIKRWKKHPQWRPREVKWPEKLNDPKSELRRMSQAGRIRPSYEPHTDNHLIASHLNLGRVADKCPSFRCLRDYVCRES